MHFKNTFDFHLLYDLKKKKGYFFDRLHMQCSLFPCLVTFIGSRSLFSNTYTLCHPQFQTLIKQMFV